MKLKPKPWTQKWNMKNFNGIADAPKPTEKELKRMMRSATPWEKYDLMKQYRYSNYIIVIFFISN